jgi:hypothetical protein
VNPFGGKAGAVKITEKILKPILDAASWQEGGRVKVDLICKSLLSPIGPVPGQWLNSNALIFQTLLTKVTLENSPRSWIRTPSSLSLLRPPLMPLRSHQLFPSQRHRSRIRRWSHPRDLQRLRIKIGCPQMPSDPNRACASWFVASSLPLPPPHCLSLPLFDHSGSGNGLSISIHGAVDGFSPSWAALNLIKGASFTHPISPSSTSERRRLTPRSVYPGSPLITDLCSIKQGSRPRLISFLSTNVGLTAEVDLGE